MAGRRQPGHPEQSPALARNAVGSRSRAASGPRAPARVRPSPPLPSIFLYRSSQSSPPKVSQTHRTPQGPTRAIAIPHSLLPTALLLKHRTAAAPPPTPRKRVMAHKRPLDAAPPEQEAARSPRKRLRRTVLVMMWLERRRARAVTTVGQMAQMVRQAQLDVAKLFMLLVVLVARLGSMERLLLGLPNLLQRMLEEQFDAFHRSLMVSIQDTIRSTVQTEIRQAASLPNGSEPPRQISEGFPETGGITRVKLRFVDVDRPEDPLFTGCPVQWQNGRNAKVAIFGNDRQIMQGDLSKLQIEILAVHADFFTEQGQEDFTKEEFNKQIYMHKGKELVLTTVNLTNGESSLGSFLFPESSHGKKLRLTARVKRQVRTTRVQEAITDPFVVKDRRSELNKKSYPPSKEEPVHCLEKISLKGKHCTILVEKKITTVKHLMRHYHRDESGLQKLTGMKKGAWNTMINHATTCVPGNEMYSYWAPEDKCEILFNDLYDLVGKMTDDDYVPYSVNDVDQFPQHKVNNWKKSAYKKFDERESSGDLIPDYFMNNGRPVRAVPHDAGPSVQEFGDRRPLNGFSRAAVLSNNDTGPSNKETLPFSQHMYQGLGQHDPSMTQNGTPDYQGNVLNDQGSFSAQPTIPSHILVPPPQDDMITGASITGQGTSSLNHVPSDISSGSPSVQARTPWQYPNGMAAHHEFGDRHPLNGFSRVKFLSNNDASPSNQETLLFPQHTYQGFGQHNPSISQNGTPDYVPQGTILNDQGRFSAESTIPPHNFSPVPWADMITGASLAGQQHGYLSFSTTDAPGTSYPVADVAGTSSDGVSLGTSSLNHVQTDIFSGLTPIQFQVLLELQAPLADQDFAQTNSEPLNSDSQFQGYEHDGGAC